MVGWYRPDLFTEMTSLIDMKTKRSRWLTGLYTLSVLSMVVVAASPWSRWVVLSHTRRERFFDTDVYTGKQSDSDDAEETAKETAESKAVFTKACATLDKAAERHAGDAGIQLAYALRRMDAVDDRQRSGESAQRIHPLLTRFPDSPLVLAAWFRFRSPAIMPGSDEPVPSQATITEFIDTAKRGERLDSRNAYFTSMRMIGLLAGGHRNEAAAALHEAAGKSVWEDYSVGEADGAVRLMEASTRVGDPYVWLVEAPYLDFPHLAPLRRAAISLRDLAVELETSGRAVSGVRIRHDIIVLGGMIRSQSHSSTSSRLGMNIEHNAVSRPGGAPSGKRPDGQSNESYAKARLDRYLAFLTRSGIPPEEAKWAREQAAADAEADNIIRDGKMKVDPFYDSLNFAFAWGPSLFLFWGIAGILLLFAIARALSRLPFARDILPLPAQGGWGIWLGLIPFAIMLGLRHAGISPWIMNNAMAIVSATAIVIGLSRRRAAIWQGALVAACVYAALCVPPKGMVNVELYFLLFAMPFGRRSKAPLVAGLIRATNRWAPPTIALAVLLYSGLVYVAGIHYRSARVDMPRMVHDENRYYADVLGRRWPE